MPTIEERLAFARRQLKLGNLADAETTCREILRDAGGNAQALQLLSVIALDADQEGLALAFIRKAISICPDDITFHLNLGAALLARRAFGEAIAAAEHVLVLSPQSAKVSALAWSHIGNARLFQGELEEAVAAYRVALVLDPNNSRIHSNLMLCLQYSPSTTQEQLLVEARRWGERFGETNGASRRWYDRDRNPDRRLRIGYVSADLWRHSVAYLLSPVLRTHNRHAFEVFVYSNSHRTDAMTDSLRAKSDTWRSLVGVEDDEAAALIRQDEIDVLIDLSGHTAGNRLTVLAEHVAPVQMTWLGYSGTTGLAAIDYLIGDQRIIPAETERWYSESIIRMPEAYLCYEPLEFAPELTPLPCLSRGHMTFGSFNNLSKVTSDVVETWAAIMTDVKDAHLILKAPALEDREVRDHYTALFARHGVDADRLRLIGHTRQSELLSLYGEVDIALDPFPYNGTVTSLETLWMGVPLVSLAGDRFVARVGLTILAALGLEDLVVTSRHQYVERATQLASDRRLLSCLRTTLRSRMASSPLLDAHRFTEHLEARYRDVWRRWCRSGVT